MQAALSRLPNEAAQLGLQGLWAAVAGALCWMGFWNVEKPRACPDLGCAPSSCSRRLGQ